MKINPVSNRNIITLILVNGFHIKGYDSYAVWIESDNKCQLVYKYTISTIQF
ncbi:RNA chaperone Hfq [Bacillus wiedmannii]|uniref:RNA chaperone Hfq n=1 Tax=Bacillus wiedmannii TaxID=1890302 RepID=UPI000BEE5FE6|nr:RNA chaperone Hfq [Bacillus wiedmannii]PDZ42496.1 hypothetical protein CON82_29165 [Bacillus wiedmannii]